jgi:hypothetical protein
MPIGNTRQMAGDYLDGVRWGTRRSVERTASGDATVATMFAP